MRFIFALVSLVIFIFIANYDPVEPLRKGPNEFIFERVWCEKTPNATMISALLCEAKYVKHGYVRGHAYVNLTEPLHDAWFHFVFYYRYNNPGPYQKFPIDLWENPCDWLKGKKFWMLDWGFKNLWKYLDTNVNHPCPYEGYVYGKVDNVSTSVFYIEQLLPASKYRVDVSATDGSKKKVLVRGQFFFSISDTRVERFW